ncbi:glutamate--tRNA ligase [Sphingoaurantiacus capsulatus]|uniref:Glutamate--tRNA ligase n=1 Tax=Sphingoaurantiacus capsulatus TaxID=1771310 RepID=A0ABV7XF26_9SPHN
MGASTSPKVVTRFAPSPTGYLHIGGARTALFNFLFARHHGGEFKLRIEDTDRARMPEGATEAIFDALGWLGLQWDGEAIFQFARAARHAEVAHELLAKGGAYKCWMTPEELAAGRAAAEAARKPFRLSSPWRDRSDGPADQPFVVRLRAPREGAVTIDDQVQGDVTVQNAELDDMVLLRSDGTPTYMLAVVVDDHDMGVTHVIRGDDHLNNAFRQLALIRALGWPEPVYAHVPLIHGPDGAKLSKRHGAVGAETYRDMGILPEALENYLLRLGWGHGDAEIISREQAIKWFDLAGVGRAPARLDPKKLEHINGHYLRETDDARLVDLIVPLIGAQNGRNLNESERALLLRSMPELKARAKDLNELASASLFLFRTRPIPLDERAQKLLEPPASDLLSQARDALAASADWSGPALEAAIRELAERIGVGLGKIAQPLRAALTGSSTSPGIFDVLDVLGRDESLGRIDDQLR